MPILATCAKRVLPAATANRLRTWRDRRELRGALAAVAAGADRRGGIAAAVGALEAASRATPEADAGAWFERVEARRLELLRAREPISIVDHGLDPARGPVRREAPLGRIAEASGGRPWCEFLFHLARAARPERVVEMGACVGVSASYIAAALEANGRGRLVTLEGDPTLSGITRDTLDGLGLGHRAEVVCGPFERTLEAALARMRPVDLLFHDGAHDASCYEQDFATMRPYLAPGAVVVFDDIRWRKTDTLGAWRRIVAHQQVTASLDCGTLGVFATKAA